MKPTDTQMLDWLEQQGKGYYFWKMQTERDYPNIKGCAFLMRNSTSGAATAREAIAEAMKRGKK